MTIDQSAPRAVLQIAAYCRSLGADVRAPVDRVEDSGNANAGDGGGTQPVVFTTRPHGLNPGDRVTLSGTAGYDGPYVVEPADDVSFLIDDVAYSGPSTGGAWSPDEIY